MNSFESKCEARKKCHFRTHNASTAVNIIISKISSLAPGEDHRRAGCKMYELGDDFKELILEQISLLKQLRSSGLLHPLDLMELSHHDLPLQLLADLSRQRILNIQDYIEGLMDDVNRTTEFTRTIADALFTEIPSRNKTVTQILSDLVMLTEVFDGELQITSKLILDSVFRKYWTRINSGESGSNPFLLLLHSRSLNNDELKPTFRRVFKYLLTFKPEIKIANAFVEQECWGFFCVDPLVAESLLCLCVPFSSSETLSLLTQVLESKEVNWRTVLLAFSVFILRFEDGASHVKDLIRQWLADSLHEQQKDLLLTVLLVARQAAGEGQHLFPSYQRWLSETFGDLSSSPASSGKRYAYLIDTLLSLLPHESLAMLKAHVAKPPAAPQDMKFKLKQFLNETRTRIAELDGSYDAPFTVRSKIDLDVASAIETFEKTGKVPNTLMEASIFRMPYFQGKFLPALLAPRVIPDHPDAREKLINTLRMASKISNATYSVYQAACSSYTNQLAEGIFLDEEMPEEKKEESIVCLDID